MSDRPTPETDALITLRSGFGVTDYEWRQHSRNLERERDEARELARELLDALLAREELNQVGLLFADEALLRRVDETHRKAIAKAKEVLP
jgi:hypothetical protein